MSRVISPFLVSACHLYDQKVDTDLSHVKIILLGIAVWHACIVMGSMFIGFQKQ